ncbi:hypothetical protein HDU84_004522 [Entophlyctis sp. JEL0112]|nr:hypothetical protein HDU84_004522 [Entophlyctis sp. JEL0112]
MEFNPTWLEIQNAFYSNGWNNITNFGIGKVQCLGNEEFCDKWNIDGYPTVNLYVDGYFSFEIMSEEYAAVKKEAERLIQQASLVDPSDVDVEAVKSNATDSNSKDTVELVPSVAAQGPIRKKTPSKTRQDIETMEPVVFLGTIFVVVALFVLFLRNRRNRYFGAKRIPEDGDGKGVLEMRVEEE